MNNTDFASKKLKGRDVSAAPRIKNYNNSGSNKEVQSGRSMIEMLGVLAIIGVLSVGGIAGYSKAMMKYKINKTIEQITLIAGNVRSFFRGNYKDLNTYSTDTYKKIIKKAKLVPDEMWNENNWIEDLWGGEIAIMPAGKGFSYVFIDGGMMPQEACIEIVSQDWSSSGVKIIEIFTSDTNYIAPVPVSLENAITACSDMSWFQLDFDIDLTALIASYIDPYTLLE